MIKLFDGDIKTLDRKSSKGNQLKFERNNMWYKADNMGYEGLSEYVISKLLKYSNLSEEEFVDYNLESIEYNDIQYPGCVSRDFSENYKIITLERLFTQFFGTSLNRIIYGTEDHTERLKIIVDQTIRITGLSDFGKYMSKIITIDSLFLNEDRHTHNLAVMMNDRNEFKLCPIFDNGAALLSDTKMDYPLGRNIIELIERCKPVTFCSSFDEQLEIAESLYGGHLHFSFGEKEITEIVDAAELYDQEIKDRVIEIIMQMRRKYEYLFV